jgi:hypothetical protein
MGPDQNVSEEGAASMDEREIESLKPEINNLIWMYAPDSLTLRQAEEMALAILDIIMTGKIKNESRENP